MNLSATEIAALALGGVRIGVFIRLATDLRLWLGLGSIRPGVNALDAEGATYAGQIVNLPAMKQLINGTADRAEISLSGADNRILALANSAAAVQGKTCDVGFALMGHDWALLGAVHWCQRYFGDFLRMTVTPASEPGQQTVKTAALSIRSQMTGRRRRGLSYFTNQDQQAPGRSPTDRMCERTPQYSQIGNKTWPKY